MDTQTNSNVLPVELPDYQAPERETKTPRKLRAGVYALNIASIETGVAQTGTLRFKVTLNPVLDGEVKRTKIIHWLNLPFQNPNVAGHKQPNTMSFCYNFLSALGLVERKYRYQKEGTKFFDYDGNEVSQSEFASKQAEIDKQCNAELKKLWADEGTRQNLIGVQVYGYLRYAKDKQTGDTSDFISVANFSGNGDNVIESEDDAYSTGEE